MRGSIKKMIILAKIVIKRRFIRITDTIRSYFKTIITLIHQITGIN